MAATKLRKIHHFKDAGEKFTAYPMDHGGWRITYGDRDDLTLTYIESHWMPSELVDNNTDEGEDEVRWPTLKAAKARVYELNRM